jgi:hypothetical protein
VYVGGLVGFHAVDCPITGCFLYLGLGCSPGFTVLEIGKLYWRTEAGWCKEPKGGGFLNKGLSEVFASRQMAHRGVWRAQRLPTLASIVRARFSVGI